MGFYAFFVPLLILKSESKVQMQIDIDKIVGERATKTKVPKLVVNYLKKIAHQDEMNGFLSRNPEIKDFEFVGAALKFLDMTMEVEGKENLPAVDGTYTFVSNHPLGGLDGLAIGYVLAQAYNGRVRYLSNDLLSNIDQMKGLFIPVNKVGNQGKANAEMMRGFYESNNHLMTFPAGMCSRKVNGKITDMEWKKHFVAKAVEYHRDVVPIYFEGKNSRFFYNLANLRKFLKIKFNIEMMYLADEMFKQRGKHFKIKIGKPIPWQTFDKTKSYQEWAQWVKEIVYKMG